MLKNLSIINGVVLVRSLRTTDSRTLNSEHESKSGIEKAFHLFVPVLLFSHPEALFIASFLQHKNHGAPASTPDAENIPSGGGSLVKSI